MDDALHGLSAEGEADQEVVVAFALVDEEVDGVGRGQGVFCPVDLLPAFTRDVVGRGVCVVEFEPAAVDQGEQLIAESRFRGSGEGECFDTLVSELLDEQ